MPGYKNQFRAPVAQDFTIIRVLPKNRQVVLGTVRVKPSSILWKPSGDRKYYNVKLATFTDWITGKKTDAKRTKS